MLADDVLRLDGVIALHPDARDDYDAGVSRYRAALAALDHADEPIDLVRVERVINEGRYAMRRAEAIVAGREPPPPGDDLRRPGRHDEPPLEVDEVGRPYYGGSGASFYGGGWYGGGGGMLSGLLLGSMLGGFGPFGWGGHSDVRHHGDGGDGDGDGGFGARGGDFGGGDFGGGDFGDIGGGDW